MTTFIGEYPCKIDAKGRIILPSSFKKQISPNAKDKFVVKRDIFEKCLVLYPMDEWEIQIENLRKKINPYNREHNRFLDAFYKGTVEVALDTNNRLLIPKRLLEKADITKDIILSAQIDKIKIWNEVNYEVNSMEDNDFASLAEKILGDNPLDSEG